MTIYITPFRTCDKETTGPSEPAPFETIDDAIAVFGDKFVRRGPRSVIYDSGPGMRLIISDYIFALDATANKA